MIDSVPKLQRRPSISGLHIIGIDEFPDFVASMHKDNNAGFFTVFQVILLPVEFPLL